MLNMIMVVGVMVDNLYPFSVHVVTFTFHYQLMHLLIRNPFTVHIKTTRRGRHADT